MRRRSAAASGCRAAPKWGNGSQVKPAKLGPVRHSKA